MMIRFSLVSHAAALFLSVNALPFSDCLDTVAPYTITKCFHDADCESLEIVSDADTYTSLSEDNGWEVRGFRLDN